MKALKHYIVLLALTLVSSFAFSQQFSSPMIAFNQAANEYIYHGTGKAVQTLNTALQQFPEDEKLKALLEKILKDKQQQENKEKEENKEQGEKKEQEEKKNDKEQQQNQQQQEKEKQEQEKKQQEQQQQNKDQSQEKAEEDKDAEKKEKPENMQASKEEKDAQDKKDEQEAEVRQNLEEMKISPEKAQMILDAMKNNEIQYIQQMERKPSTRPDPNKPDW